MLNRNELIDLLNNNIQSIYKMNYNELKDKLGVSIADMYEYNQDNPHHCYDLLTHSLKTVSYISQLEINQKKKDYLLIAALFHDVGKPKCAFYKNGTKHFYGHALKSRDIAEEILKDLGFNNDEILLICFYIAHHDDFISLHDVNKESVLKIVNKMIKKEKELYDYDITINHYIDLMDLCYGDAYSQSDAVYKDGKIINSKSMKLEKTDKIKNILIKEK